MSDTSQGPGWWQASDGKWYPPQQQQSYWSPPPPQIGYATPPYPGAFQQPYPPGGAQSTNGLAIASLVLSIVWLGGLGSVLAVIFGIVARRQIRASGGRQGGDGVALAGLLIGIVGVLGVALLVGLAFAVKTQVQNVIDNQVIACQADTKSVETALAAYRAQNDSYPRLLAPWGSSGYAINYSTLTTAGAKGSPWLRVAPPTSHYVVEYDSNGRVWVEGPGTYDATYNAAQDLEVNPNACNVAFP
jgi:Domain of unknown function (DUF4190)